MTDDPDRVALEIVTTLDDQTAFGVHMLNTPPLGPMRRRWELAAIASAPLWFAGGVFGAWLLDPDHPSFGQYLAFVAGHPAAAFGGLVIAFAAMILGLLLNRVWARRRVVAVLRRMLRERPDVDATDPNLAHRTRATFDGHGLASETTLGHTMVKWAAIQRLDETDRHLFLIGGPFGGFMVPKRQLDAEAIECLRGLIVSNLDKARSPANRPA